MAHAERSPSTAPRWIPCPGSIALSAGLADGSSGFADEGSAAHHLGAECLANGTLPIDHIGRVIVVPASAPARWAAAGEVIPRDARWFEVDQDMVGHVSRYVNDVRDFAQSGELMVEQALSIAHVTKEAGAEGTSDAVVLQLDDEELQVHDLKYGRGVRVDAERNEQLMLYALGALEQFGLLAEFKTVRLVIHQPRLDHLSEWDCSVVELLAFGETVRSASSMVEAGKLCIQTDRQAFERTYLQPGDKQCRFCKAKATCPALAQAVQEAVGSDFENLTTFNQEMTVAWAGKRESMEAEQLSLAMRAADVIEVWLKAVRAEVERRLLAGQPIDGFKLVQGKRGARAWSSVDEAEATLKSMRVKHDQMYDYSVISPTSAEKLLKAEVIGKRQWPRLAALITQSDGKPSVAPASDKRPALVVAPPEDDFEVVDPLEASAEDLV